MAELNVSEAAQAVEKWLASLMQSGDTNAVVQGLNDPQTALTQIGVNPAMAGQINWGQAYNNACQYPGVPSGYQGGGSFGGSGSPSMHETIQQIRYVTEVNEHFDNHSQNTYTDNSLNVVGSTIDGTLNYDPHTANATGGSVAGAGDGATTGATGPGSAAAGEHGVAGASGATVIGGDNQGIVGSPGAVQAGNTFLDAGFGGGEPTRTELLDRSLTPVDGTHAPANFNINTGGGGQNIAQNLGGGDQVAGFGSGSVQGVQHSVVQDSALASGGDAHNISHNNLGPGSAIADGGSASGNSYDSHDTFDSHNVSDHHDVFTETNTVTAGDHSNVSLQNAEGHDIHQHQNVDSGEHITFPSGDEIIHPL